MNHSHGTHKKLAQSIVRLLNSTKIDQVATPTEKASESSNEETQPIHDGWVEQPIENDVRSQGDSTKSQINEMDSITAKLRAAGISEDLIKKVRVIDIAGDRVEEIQSGAAHTPETDPGETHPDAVGKETIRVHFHGAGVDEITDVPVVK